MLRSLKRIRDDETGATAIEYGLIAGLISVVIITSLELVNSNMVAVFDYISLNLGSALQ